MAKRLIIIQCLALLALLSSQITAMEQSSELIGGGTAGWEHWTLDGDAWQTDNFHNKQPVYPDSPNLRSHEAAMGSMRSPVFTIDKPVLAFTMNGWNRKDNTGDNRFELRRASDNRKLREAKPPQSDAFTEIRWWVGNLSGERVYFKAVDAISDTGFAWVGLDAVWQSGARSDNPRLLSLIPLDNALGNWGLTTFSGGGQQTSSFLTTLVAGESATGAIISPAFSVQSPTITVHARGWDGQFGDAGHNSIELIDVENDTVLRSSIPPLNDFPQPIIWQTEDLIGKQVAVRVVDKDDGGGFAWLGLDSIDAGEAYQVDFATGRDALEGWQALQSGPTFTSIDGLAFRATSESLVPPNGTFTLPVATQGGRYYLLGMTNTLDQGCPVWAPPEFQGHRFFIGDKIGDITLTYEDETEDHFPVILGDNAWWGRQYFIAPEPFASNDEARELLERSLRLYPRAARPDRLYIAALEPRKDKLLTALSFSDDPDKIGVPVLKALSFEVTDEALFPEVWEIVEADEITPELETFIEQSAMRPDESIDEREARLEALRDLLYTTHENFPEHVEFTFPEGYKGPRVTFEGDPYARVLTNIFHYNIADLLAKTEPDGHYHTSTLGAPSWGGYTGFGTWAENRSSYHGQTWMRDLGRALQELVALGYLEEGRRTAKFCIEMARAWEGDISPKHVIESEDQLYLNGVRLPVHWNRRILRPDTRPHQGAFDNDSHGLTMLFMYQLWRRLPEAREWLEANAADLTKHGDWIQWQFDHPETSGAKDLVLQTDSESSAGTGFSIYPDFTCMEGLEGFAQMFENLGNEEQAKQWRETAERLHQGMLKYYKIKREDGHPTWTLDYAGWPNRSTVLAPVIITADRKGFAPEVLDPQLRKITENTLDELIARDQQYTPFGSYGIAMGYGQGFVTQTALLLDRMADAEEMLRWVARLTYYNVDNEAWRYIVPEGTEVHISGNYWHRIGDLGNNVQQAEIVKVLRIVVGIDDADPEILRFFPRMPRTWERLAFEDFPAWVHTPTGPQQRSLKGELLRTATGFELELESDKALGPVQMRLGPLPDATTGVKVLCEGKELSHSIEESGDSQWVRFIVQAEKPELSLEVRTNN